MQPFLRKNIAFQFSQQNNNSRNIFFIPKQISCFPVTRVKQDSSEHAGPF